MKVECAWCRKDIDSDVSASTSNNAPVSHGICPDCIITFFSFMGKPMKDYLDEFTGPVFLVDSTNKIITANSEALALTHKKSEEIEEKKAGDVFECPHASQEAGCGGTIHCKSCTIRKAILSTSQTGQASIHLPAYADLHCFLKDKKTKFFVSTEKVGEAIFLRIEDVSLD